MIILDALYPGTPTAMLANVRAVGAAGCLGYVWRPGGIGGWTAAHYSALEQAGMVTAPIVVPAGDSSTPYATLIQAAQSFGFHSGPLICDMESPANLPSQAWWNGAIAAFRAAGYRALKYGNAGDVGAYANGDGWWIASYIQHSVQPVPTKSAQYIGWQYGDQVFINSVEYDASIFDEEALMSLVGLDPNDPTVADIRNRLGGLQYGTIPQGGFSTIGEITLRLRDIQTAIGNLSGSGGSGMTAAQAQQLSDIQAAVNRIEAALKGA